MAETLSDFKFKHAKRGKYGTYLDGQVWRIPLTELGVDYNTAQAAMHRKARDMGRRLHTHNGGDFIVVQAIPNGDGHQ